MFARLLTRFLRLFFHLLYHPFAWAYDLVAAAVSLGRWKGWVLAVVPYLRAGHILELGYGPGHLQATLKQKGFSAIGLDESAQMARRAQRRLRRLGFTPSLLRGNAQNLPFPAGAFSQIVATFPTEYILQPATLSEIWRVLQPGGEAVILPMAWITGKSLPERLMARLFYITRQTSDNYAAALEPATRAGYTARTERLKLVGSELLIVILTKPPAQFNHSAPLPPKEGGIAEN